MYCNVSCLPNIYISGCVRVEDRELGGRGVGRGGGNWEGDVGEEGYIYEST